MAWFSKLRLGSKKHHKLEMPALGRPFTLGMLYDCREDNLVPGLTLWDLEDLENDRQEKPKHHTEYKIVTSESFSDKFSSLNVEGELKASFLSGLVSVGGSAKYLKDNRTSKKQARVTLQYKTTTHIKQLSMNHLGKGQVKHPDVFDQDMATHVVTAILYGAQAFFVFDQEVSDTENLRDIQGNLHGMINKIPKVSGGGGVSLKKEDKHKERMDRFSCTFYGDFQLEHSPTTFEEAVNVYRNLPKLLGHGGENAVPLKVWLLPLTALDSKAAKLVREISVKLVSKAQSFLERFGDLEMRCNDVLHITAVQQFPQIARKIKTFMGLCNDCKSDFQRTLTQKLPAIRRGGEEEAELVNILKKIAASPFNSNNLNKWMDNREKEAYTLMTFTNLMTNTKVVPSENHLIKETSSIKTAVCFVFTSLESADPYLSVSEKYLNDPQSCDFDPRAQLKEEEQWYNSKEVQKAIKCNVKLFCDFSKANKDDSSIKFLAVGLKDENHQGSAIYLYTDGFEKSDEFQPPSKPEAVTVGGVEHNRVVVEFSPPRFGAEAVTGYRVEYCAKGETEWHQQNEDKAGTVTVAGLKPETEYSFRVRALTDIGLGPDAQANPIKTLPEPEGPRRLAEDLRKTCELLETKGSLQILQVPLIKDQLNINGCRWMTYGQDSVKRNCTIMLMGASGAGKSTLINGMINYIFGIQWSDSYRFKLVVEDEGISQTQSQTSEVTVYKVNYQDAFPIDYSLTIIDTPGFGDTRGIQRDQEITEQIRTLFSCDFGVNDIHIVCFVAKSSSARLSATQLYVFESVLSIFGNDMAETIEILVTFADGQLPPVLKAINEAGVPCPRTDDGLPAHYKFNNSALFAEKQTEAKDFDEMFWDMGNASMKSFFNALDQTEPKSLTLTKEVLKERRRLESSVENLEKQVKIGLAKLNEINETRQQIKIHEANIEKNKHFKITITVVKPIQEDISGTGKYITNCQFCHYTCHYPCNIDDDRNKNKCLAMEQDGNCKVCPKKCHWTKHFNQRYKWEYKKETETQTVEDIKQKYLQKTEEKKTTEALVQTLEKEYQKVEKMLSTMVQEATSAINRLKEIALKPKSLSTPDYFHLLIEREERDAKEGWKQRVQALHEVKRKAEILDKVDKGEALLS